MKRFSALLGLAALAGCGISRDTWLAEVDKREGFEKQLAICRSRLGEEEKRSEGLDRDLAAERDGKASVQVELERARARAAECQGQLTEAVGREQGTKVGLEGSERLRKEAERDRDALRAMLDADKSAGAAERGKYAEVAADRDRLRAERDAERSSRAEEKGRSSEIGADRDRLRQELDSAWRAAEEEGARFTAAVAEGDRLRGELQAEKTARAAEVDGLRRQVAELEGRAVGLAEEKKQTEREKAAKLDEVTRSYDELMRGMKAELDRGQVTISQLKDRLTVNLLDEILFASGSAKVNPKGTDVLSRVGEVLKKMEDKAIVIEGHTDSVPLKGELAKVFPTNWELSTARATSVVRYLQEKVGIDPKRLSAAGFGPNRPLDSNETPEGRTRNRRIEIKLVPFEVPATSH